MARMAEGEAGAAASANKSKVGRSGRKAMGLTAAKVRTAKPGRYGDGRGLYLFVRSADARFWVYRYTREGRMREMGLGRAGEGDEAVSLAEARDKAAVLFKLVREGVDPLDQREAEAKAAAAEAQKAAIRGTTFRTVAERYLDAHEKTWRNPKHRLQWRNTLDTYAHPHFGDLPVGEVATEHVLAALEPIWRAKPETATRVRGRIESVLDYAAAREWRTGENPARWRGHLANLLPARGKVAPVEHHAALPWHEIGAFLPLLEAQAGVSAKALHFLILTAARSGEVLGARWGELDLAAKVWTVPAARMKAGREHRVPLSAPALAILTEMRALRRVDAAEAFVFPGAAEGRPLSIMAMAMVLRRMKRGDLTVHGFRSTFRDWVGEATVTPREVAEAALAHTLADKTEAAYARGDLFAKRVRLMEDWAKFCRLPPRPPNVKSLHGALAAK
jgi:integrase